MDPFLAELRIVAFNFAPQGWAFCNGQTLPIAQNQALFSLLGTMYGGNGVTTFALPDLRGRVPMYVGNGHIQGNVFGEVAHNLTISEMPTHTHQLQGSSAAGTSPVAANNVHGTTPAQLYAAPNNPVQLNAATLANYGSGQTHDNMQPYLVLNFCIALVGIFPSRN